VVEPGSCFAGCLLELALSADRIYMLDTGAPLRLSAMNFGALPMVTGRSRLGARLNDQTDALRRRVGEPLDASEALKAGLATFVFDELDWAEELRLAIEGRTALSPDALTGLEANLRFGDTETMETRIFGRLSAWQNWIFSRPNAAGPNGTLKSYGTGNRPKFDGERV
jgi:benzoyl-CoA-dihydrodiol lyase